MWSRHENIFVITKKAKSYSNMALTNQGMYKNRVNNDRFFFAIPALLSCERGNPEQENSK